ncbi:MAG: OsmC family peroxiredoxin [Acidimicrobiales bacterium]
MTQRRAHTMWTGTLQEGAGHVTLASSGAGAYDVTFPRRTAEDAEGVTSPEELLAAAHSACYAMQLSALIARAGGTPESLDVDAAVTLRPDPAGGFRITTVDLVVRASVSGLDEAAFVEVAEAAKQQCPVSKALTGVDVTLDAALR